jgi:cysteine desulfurase
MRYFDHNATTPLAPAARTAWLDANDRHWHNASSLYREAGLTSQALAAAREELADLLDTEPERLIFTAGATESNNTVFAGLARCLAPDAVIALSAVEHPSVREAACAWLGRHRVRLLDVDAEGVVQPSTLEACLREHQPALVSVMAANNESGALQPWAELARLCRAHGTRFHCDAAQWLGKQPAAGLGTCDYVTGSAHKFGGPKGIGFLLAADASERFPLLHGGPQEDGRRAGTENVPAVAAMVAALRCAEAAAASVAEPQSIWRDACAARLQQALPGLRVISAGAPRLWNTLLVVLPRHSSLKWLTRLSRRGFAISTGSACSSGREGSSVVLQALGAEPGELRRVLRFSGGWHTTETDWQALAEAVIATSEELDQGPQPPGANTFQA